ncbi:RHS repeat domain-containing protein, partial [Gallibacterium anatis]
MKRTFADGSTVKMERNSLGQLLSQTDSAGRTTAYRYNELGQITQISIGEQKQLFEYNDKG